jgi:hypothetical protein
MTLSICNAYAKKLLEILLTLLAEIAIKTSPLNEFIFSAV